MKHKNQDLKQRIMAQPELVWWKNAVMHSDTFKALDHSRMANYQDKRRYGYSQKNVKPSGG